jgi:hypothetical protein
MLSWEWEHDPDFDRQVAQCAPLEQTSIKWIDLKGSPINVSGGVTIDRDGLVQRIICGEACGDLGALYFRDPDHYRAGELHEHLEHWLEIVGDNPTSTSQGIRLD